MGVDLEVKCDTARDQRRWYIDGYARHFFTSRDDAEAALALAAQIAGNAEREICNIIRDALPR